MFPFKRGAKSGILFHERRPLVPNSPFAGSIYERFHRRKIKILSRKRNVSPQYSCSKTKQESRAGSIQLTAQAPPRDTQYKRKKVTKAPCRLPSQRMARIFYYHSNQDEYF
jgi:hypothetical protein